MLATLPPIGSLIAEKYRLELLLGEGGMGGVYRARHIKLDKPVALKLMLPRYARDQDVASRFLREARAAARIQHPNVVEVLDFGVHEGCAYLVMELLQGESLEDLMTRRPLTPLEALTLLADAMRGVAFAHANGVIHRDIKPANIFVARGRDGLGRWAKILDFGISKVADETSNLTQPGAALGTPEYMSYEHMRDAKGVDARADVYSFGVVLYRALTGVSPFAADSLVEVALKVATHQPPPLRKLVPALPAELDRLVMRMIARNKEERVATLREVCEELVTMLASESFKKQLAGLDLPWNRLESSERDSVTEITDGTEIRTFQADRVGLAIVRSTPPPAVTRSSPPRAASTPPARASRPPSAVHPAEARSRMEPRASTRPDASLQPPPSLFAGATEATMNPAAVFLGVAFALLAVLGAWVLGSSRMPLGVSAPRTASAPAGTTINLRTSPPGASVVVDGIVYGPTPTRIVLRQDAGELQGPKRFRFVLRGYEEAVVTRELRGDSMEVEAPPLRPLRTKP